MIIGVEGSGPGNIPSNGRDQESDDLADQVILIHLASKLNLFA